MMGVEQYRTRLGWYIRDLIDNGDFSGTAWLERGNTLLNMCLPAALEDTYRTLDYGFDNDDYLNCLTSGSGGHVTQGIAENVNARATSAYSQTSDAQFPRDIQAWVYTPVVDDTLRVKAEAAGTPLSVQLHLSVDGGPYNTYAMNDDGLSGDGLAGDAPIWLKVHLPNADQVSWYTSATYSDGAQPTDPCVPGQVWIDLHPQRALPHQRGHGPKHVLHHRRGRWVRRLGRTGQRKQRTGGRFWIWCSPTDAANLQRYVSLLPQLLQAITSWCGSTTTLKKVHFTPPSTSNPPETT